MPGYRSLFSCGVLGHTVRSVSDLGKSLHEVRQDPESAERFWAFRHPRTLWPPSRANQDCDFSVYGERAVVYDAAVFDNSATAICAAQHPTLTSDEHRR